MAYKSIFLWLLLQTVKNSIMTYNNALVSGLLGEQFKLGMMVPQRSEESLKISKGIPVSLPVTILETQYNTEERGSIYIVVEPKKMIIHQRLIPDQNCGADKPPSKITEEVMAVDTEKEENKRRRKDI